MECIVPNPVILTDFLLHVGPNGDTESCALLRHPGDTAIDEGTVTVKDSANGSYEVAIQTTQLHLILPDVLKAHADLIRQQGLYVIQRDDDAQDPRAVLLSITAC
jgi:hypothetical protein